MDMDKKIKALENENLENKNKTKRLEVNNAKLEKKLKSFEERLQEVEAVLVTDFDAGDLSEYGKNANLTRSLSEELKALIAESEESRDTWEMTKKLAPDITSLVNSSIEEDG